MRSRAVRPDSWQTAAASPSDDQRRQAGAVAYIRFMAGVRRCEYDERTTILEIVTLPPGRIEA